MKRKNEAPGRPGSNVGATANVGINTDTRKPYAVTLQHISRIVSPKYPTTISRILEGRAMKQKAKTPGIRGMNLYRALSHCAKLTSAVWSQMEVLDTLELWKVFKAYILNNFQDTGISIPPRFVDVWWRCKVLIEKEVRR